MLAYNLSRVTSQCTIGGGGGCGVWGVLVREGRKIKRLPAKNRKKRRPFSESTARRAAVGKEARELWSDVAIVRGDLRVHEVEEISSHHVRGSQARRS